MEVKRRRGEEVKRSGREGIGELNEERTLRTE